VKLKNQAPFVDAEESKVMIKSKLVVFAALTAFAANALSQMTAVVAVEPSSKQEAFTLSRASMESSLKRLTGQEVSVTTTEDLADVMRATRSSGYDVFIAPPQVAASALSRGYELLGSTAPAEQFVLVGKRNFKTAQDLKGGKLYLPQQDSIYTYMARGMLNASGLSFKDLGRIEYARYPEAGLVAVHMGYSDATVIRRSEWEVYARNNPEVATVLATSTPVPGGLSVVVKKDLPDEVRSKLTRWFATSGSVAGLKPVEMRSDLGQYKAVGELALFTPRNLPGAQLVTAREAQQLISRGAVLVDTRTEKEYKTKRIPQAVLIPYVEKSLKDVAFDARQDEFAGLDKLDKSKPTIFACNGAECWKSYKASKVALERGFKQVYWFRGGLPEWVSAGLQTPSD
jgi:rhodanese-related sulfurtransferase/ABC-type phosphate/phosphonate transport system substrate-binding protein